MITASELERELKELLHNVHRLMPPLNERPHLFHEQKDALGRAVINLMDKCGFRPPPSPRAYRTPQADTGITSILGPTGRIPVERRNVR